VYCGVVRDGSRLGPGASVPDWLLASDSESW